MFILVSVLTSTLLLSASAQPVAEWRLDESTWSSGSPVKSTIGDIDGTAVNLAFPSNASPAIAGSEGTCGYGQFNGVNQFVNIPYQQRLNPDDFTVSLWARVDGNSGRYRSPITSRYEDSNGNQQGYMIYAGLDNRWQFWTGNGGYWDIMGSDVSVETGVWTHIAISFETSSVNGNLRTGTKTLYVNGAVAVSRTGDYRPNRVGALTIGAGGGSGNRYHFNGGVDEVAIYNSALSGDEIASLSRKTHSCTILPVPTAEWLLDEQTWEGRLNEVMDFGGNALDGNAVNGARTAGTNSAIVGNPGTCGYGLFNGVNQFVNIPYQQQLNPDDFTVSLWARVDGNSGTYRSPITSRYEDSNGNQQGYVIYAGLDNRWQFWTGNGGYWDIMGSDVSVETGVWTHIAISFETSSVNGNLRTGTKTLYVNGAVAVSRTGDYRPNRVGALTIGAGGGSGNRYHFNGGVDEVSVYSSTLSRAAIELLASETHQCSTTPTNPTSNTKVELMVVNSHCDDEGIFGGGILPYYAQEKGVKVAALTMVTRNGDGSYPITSGSVSRVQELRNAVDVYAGQPIGSGSFNQLGHYTTGNIVLLEGGLIDTGCCSSDPGFSWNRIGNTGWGRSSQVTQLTPGFGNLLNIDDGRRAAATVIAREIRRHRPRILVTVHDLEGDYGHSNHAGTAIGVIDGYELAADPNFFIDGLAPWRAEKLYLRGSPNDNQYQGANPTSGSINWYGFIPSSALHGHFHDFMERALINGESARQVAEDGVDQHFSQSSLTDVASVFKPNSRFDGHYSEWWTLYRSTIGGDPVSTFSVNGDLTGTRYVGWSRGDFL